ncbi:MAG: sigma factor-like helix-turn-helix DNA-binding protein [Lachnospiraceae bacterium]|nr:sigma factor-like helix-turn-helix DNA-binding protein [Lachnospiraceae bacterium]
MSVAEISKTLKIPEGTVKTRLYKARKLLKE